MGEVEDIGLNYCINIVYVGPLTQSALYLLQLLHTLLLVTSIYIQFDLIANVHGTIFYVCSNSVGSLC